MAGILEKLNLLLANTGDMALKRRAKDLVLALELTDGDKVLDMGCGDGYYAYLMSNLGLKLNITASDFDPVGLLNAKKNLKSSIKVIQSDLMQKTPFKNSEFDKIVMSEVAEHLPDDLKGLKEVYRILKPDGILALSVPDHNYPILWDPVNWILERTLGIHVKSGFFAGIWNQHIRLYKRSQIVNVVERAGFKVEEAKAITLWSLPFNHYLVNLVARALHGGALSKEAASALNKYEKSPKRPGVINLAFGLVNLVDKLNDLCSSKEIGVSIFVKARK